MIKSYPTCPKFPRLQNPINPNSPLLFALATITMTKLTATFLLFFFVVSSSQARDLKDRSEYEVSIPDSASLAAEDSDSKASIFLPTEKLSENDASKSTSELDQVRTEVNLSEITAFDTTETGSDPEFVITYRQIGRRSVPLINRRGRRGYHHRHTFKRWRSTDRVGEISYGNDMIVSDERSSPSSVASWGSDREIAIPSRWREFRSDSKEDRKYFHHHHHFHHHGEEEEEEHRHEHKEKSGFLRNFRKFLKQFEF